MPVCGSGGVVSSWSLLCGTHPGRFQAETPLIPLFRFPKPALYQWIIRLLGNPLVISDAVMEPFAREVLERAAADGEPLSLILDQSQMSDRHQVLMLAVRWGERALPLAWRVEETEGAIGFDTQRALLEAVAPWLPEE